jgi:hypothetical protein
MYIQDVNMQLYIYIYIYICIYIYIYIHTHTHTNTCAESFTAAKVAMSEDQKRQKAKDLLMTPITEPLEGLLQEWAKYTDEEVSMYVCMCVCMYTIFADDSND